MTAAAAAAAAYAAAAADAPAAAAADRYHPLVRTGLLLHKPWAKGKTMLIERASTAAADDAADYTDVEP